MQETESSKLNREVFRTRFSIVLIVIILSPWIILIKNVLQFPKAELIILLIFVTLIILLLAGINYVIEGDNLIFRTWAIKNGTISIFSIIKIDRSYFVLASNACSLKRLAGKTKKGSKIPFFLISPYNEDKFLERLKQINPIIEINVQNKKGLWRFWDWDI
jgi:hypothetical protein